MNSKLKEFIYYDYGIDVDKTWNKIKSSKITRDILLTLLGIIAIMYSGLCTISILALIACAPVISMLVIFSFIVLTVYIYYKEF